MKQSSIHATGLASRLSFPLRCILLLLLTLTGAWARAGWEGVRVCQIPAISQLPVSAITCIYQDSEGYMWYGTVDGLCRDDGYSVHVFRSDFNTPGLMDINSVLCIGEDRQKSIWFGTHKGVYILDRPSYRVRKVSVPGLQKEPVSLLTVRRNGEIWVAAARFLYVFHADGTLRRRIKLPDACSVLFEDRAQNLYFSTWHGEFCRVDRQGSTRLLHKGLTVRGMAEDTRRRGFWLVAGDSQIWHYRPDAPAAGERFVPMHVPEASRSAFTELRQDRRRHYLWVLSYDNLKAFRTDGPRSLEEVPTEGLLPEGKKIITHLYQAADGNIWAAAFDRPGFCIDFTSSDVRQYSSRPLRQATGLDPAIVTLCRDDDGVFWYYQEAAGLYLHDPSDGSLPVSFHQCAAVQSQPLQVIPYLVKSRRRNAIWAMTPGTVVMQIGRQGHEMIPLTYLDLTTVSKDPGAAEVIYEDRRGDLWVGTMKGVFKYDAVRKRLRCISERIGDVSDFVEAADGTVWCTVRNKGLCRILPSGQWKLYPHDIDFLTLDRTTDGTLWASTGEGQLLAFRPNRPERYEDYTRQAGLNGDMVDHVEADPYNHLWLVTPQTIREFNPQNGAVRVYSTQDHDIVQHRFLPRAVFRDRKRGEMYFGGIPGILSFRPSMKLESVPQNVRLRITDVKVSGHSLWMEGEGRQTSRQQVGIRPGDQNLSLEFSTLDFTNSHRICYAYRMQGVDRGWTYLPAGKNTATYGRLAKGDYVFEVKATDAHGMWSPHVTRIRICRLPAWWETWWAYALYAVLAAAALWHLFGRIKRGIEERNERIIEENITEGTKEYLTSISKGLDTPLQTIRSIADGMTGKADAATLRQMGMIRENVDRLQGMMQEEMETQLAVTRLDEQFIAKATRIVEEHMGSDRLDVSFLSAELGMSRSTFARKLKAVRSQTPLEFIRAIKMKHAADMLREKTASIQDVMQVVGYSDHKTFAQVFRDTFGMPPSEYQRENK